MNQFWPLTLLVFALALTGCGLKKSKADNDQMSSQYALGPFEDINNPSTLNLEQLKGLPEIIDLKEEMTSVKDQGDRGSCSFFTATALAEAAIKRKMNVEVNLSEEHLNNIVKAKGYYSDTEGGFPTQNLIIAINKKEGFVLENDWPYQPSWFGQKAPCLGFSASDSNAPAVCFTHNSLPADILARKIPASKFELTNFRTQSTNEIITFLAQSRMPLSVILPVNDRGWPNDGQSKYTEDMRAECVNQKVECGTHAVVLTGYDLKKKIFFFKNSWNKKWGLTGYGTIPFDVVDRHVDHSFSMVDLKESVDLPADFDRSPVEAVNLAVSNMSSGDSSVAINLAGTIENLGFHALQTSSTLVRRRGLAAPNEKNSDPLELSIEEQAKFQTTYVTDSALIFQVNEARDFNLEDSAAGALDFSSAIMNTETIKTYKKHFSNDLFIKTSVSIFTDEDGYMPLESFYDKLN